ncbi:type II secretion system F family protein [Arthrobacter woluwensis]|uniref:type II secretion system F family protein n=1 Tax=Arthrobacter woluwensis TaxID=156980 RepID=UPI003824FFDF
MNAILAGLCTAAIITGLIVLVIGFRPAPDTSDRPKKPNLIVRAKSWLRGLSTMHKVILAVGTLVGLWAGLSSGARILIIATPLLAHFAWMLWSKSEDAELIPLLDGLQIWARGLAGLTTTGQDLEDAIRFSLTSTPKVLEPNVRLLVARLNVGWDTESALRAFADEVNDSTCDVLVANLILTARQRTGALSASLTALATAVTNDITVRMEVEADREKPRQAAKGIAVIAVLVLLVLFSSSGYMTAYADPAMQMLLLVYIGCFLTGIWLLKRMTKSRQPIRILATEERR